MIVLNAAFFDLLTRIVHTSGSTKGASLAHSLFELSFFSALGETLSKLIHAVDVLGFLGCTANVCLLVDFGLELELILLFLVFKFLTSSILARFVLSQIVQIMMFASSCDPHLVLNKQLVHLFVCFWLECLFLQFFVHLLLFDFFDHLCLPLLTLRVSEDLNNVHFYLWGDAAHLLSSGLS